MYCFFNLPDHLGYYFKKIQLLKIKINTKQ
jgi:hypothetical protein